MKLSLSWIFDHIDADWRNFSIQEIVAQFNAKTAEIEHWYEIKFDPEKCIVGRYLSTKEGKAVLFSSELNKEILLPERADLLSEHHYLICLEPSMRWATMEDLFCQKEGFVPALQLTQEEAKGLWKKNIETHDYILEVDNKSVTHRPDLWGHRGYARELAAIFDLPLVQEDYFLAQKPIRHAEKYVKPSSSLPIGVRIESSACDRIAVFSLPQVSFTPSSLSMVLRLCRIGARPLNSIVDITNYVMYDWGQPMHAFDAQAIDQELIVRNAHEHEQVTLLDGETITLRPNDCVVADRKKVLALAGIMGGKESGVSSRTTALLLEAAHFLPTPIRLSAAQFKKRTEASARFEKSLDPLQNTQALLRFIKLLGQRGTYFEGKEAIISLGTLPQQRKLTVSHETIQEKLGTTLSSEWVTRYLVKLGFGVTIKAQPSLLYEITVPSFRVAKDISRAEDIIEEIARLFGYQNIPLRLPMRTMKPFAIQRLLRQRLLKTLCANMVQAHEVYNYALYDEELLKKLDWQPDDAVYIQNPLSENRKRLVTSLLPHLLGNVISNSAHTDQDQHFFEINKCWQQRTHEVIETNKLALVMSSKNDLDFYEGKALVKKIEEALKVTLEWRKPLNAVPLWYSKYQTAELLFEGTLIGHAGIGSLQTVYPVVERSTFIIEIMIDPLLKTNCVQPTFVPLAKFPSVTFDISVLSPLQVSVQTLEHALAFADPRIQEVQLRDYFTKAEWGDKRSLTFRCTAIDEHKTLSKEEIDEIISQAQDALRKQGTEVR